MDTRTRNNRHRVWIDTSHDNGFRRFGFIHSAGRMVTGDEKYYLEDSQNFVDLLLKFRADLYTLIKAHQPNGTAYVMMDFLHWG